METEADIIAWENLMQAHVTHNGHGADGQGSPISEIVLDHHANKYREVATRILLLADEAQYEGDTMNTNPQ